MARMTSLTGRALTKRLKVAVVYEDVTTGFQLADWFARHGYQPTLTSAGHPLEDHMRDLHPDVIVIGFSFAPPPLHSTVPRLRTTYPQVPIIAMVDQPVSMLQGDSKVDVGHAVGGDVFRCHSLEPPMPKYE